MEITAAASSTSAPATGRSRHPLTWVPSLYLAMGLPNVMVGVVAAIIYKNLGVSNEDIALYTSQMYLPWVLKPVWSPLLEAVQDEALVGDCHAVHHDGFARPRGVLPAAR